jgi:ribonuclease D
MAYMQTISSEEIEKLPPAQFRGEIHVIESENDEYKEAIEYLSRQRILGFDTETKPVFLANARRNGVAILQLAGREKAFIFRLMPLGLTSDICKLLSSSRIIKVGAAVHDDIKGLQRYSKFSARGFVDLQTIGSSWGIKEKSVRKMAAIILGIKISKSQQLSNWEADYLTSAQIQYAAIDAWSCQRMYLKLLSTPKVIQQPVSE